MNVLLAQSRSAAYGGRDMHGNSDGVGSKGSVVHSNVFEDHLRKLKKIAGPLDTLHPLTIDQQKCTGFLVDVLNSSVYFDADYCRGNYPDLQTGGIDPVEHYLYYGGVEGRRPSPAFSGTDYYHANPDVAACGYNPLLHYELIGRSEGRKIIAEPSRWMAYVDVNDKCQLACPQCVRGVQLQKNTNQTMPLDTFREIVARLKQESYSHIGFYNWTEPFLFRSLHEYVSIVKENQVGCIVSSSLSFSESWRPSILRSLAAGINLLIVTVSGFTQPVYEIYHKNGRLDWVKDNLKVIAERRRRGEIDTNVRVRLLGWKYNEHEIDLWKNFTKDLDINFEVHDGQGNPEYPIIVDQLKQGIDYRLKTTNIGSPLERFANERATGKVCRLITEQLAIDATGAVYQCSAVPIMEQTKVGQYLDMSDDEILFRRYTNPICATCDWERNSCTEKESQRLDNARTIAQKIVSESASKKLSQ
jgi:MoaA/NifB/PqqE/SkfB family radical SAM enzyme